MKRILGLDLGSTSIGWAIIDENSEEITNADSTVQNQDKIVAIGSRIIPLNPDESTRFSCPPPKISRHGCMPRCRA